MTHREVRSYAKGKEAKVKESQAVFSGGEHADTVRAVPGLRPCDGGAGGSRARQQL